MYSANFFLCFSVVNSPWSKISWTTWKRQAGYLGFAYFGSVRPVSKTHLRRSVSFLVRGMAVKLDIYMMMSFDYKYQNALRQAIVFSINSFVKNHSCVTQICITKIAPKYILVVVVKWRHHANVLFVLLRHFRGRQFSLLCIYWLPKWSIVCVDRSAQAMVSKDRVTSGFLVGRTSFLLHAIYWVPVFSIDRSVWQQNSMV